MTDDSDETEVSAFAPSGPDAFTAVLTLLALIADPTASRARLVELRQQLAAVEDAQAKLAAARAEHQATMERELKALEADKSAVAARWAELNRRSADIDQQAELHAEARAELDRLRGKHIEVLPGGGTREFFGPDDDETLPDPHFRQVADTGFRTEAVPGPPDSTLARSFPDGARVARKRARRQAEL
jgi:hypothetical protein